MVTIWLTVAILLVGGIGLNRDAYAGNGFYVLGYGPRVIGRGGADIAVADDTISINLNPAGMTRIQGQRLDLSGSGVVSLTHFENDINDEDGKPGYFLLPSIGYVNSPTTGRFAYGVAFYTPGGLGTEYSVRHPLYEDKVTYKDMLMSLRISPAFAYRITPSLSIGFAPCVSYTHLDAEGPSSSSREKVRNICQGTAFPGITFGDILGELGVDEYTSLAEMKGLESFGFGFSCGILYEINPQFTVGFSYVSRQKFDLEGDFYIDADRQVESLGSQYPLVEYLFGLLPNGGTMGYKGKWDGKASFTFPQKVGMGVAYRPSDRWLFAFDVTWIDWRDFLGDWVVKLSNGDNEDMNTIIGSPGFTDDVPQDWKDGMIWALGMEYELTEKAVLRAGFASGNNVVPSNTIDPRGPAITKNHLTLGWGYHWKSYEFNMAYEYIFPNSSSRVSHHELSRQFDNASVSVSAHILHMMYSWRF